MNKSVMWQLALFVAILLALLFSSTYFDHWQCCSDTGAQSRVPDNPVKVLSIPLGQRHLGVKPLDIVTRRVSEGIRRNVFSRLRFGLRENTRVALSN